MEVADAINYWWIFCMLFWGLMLVVVVVIKNIIFKFISVFLYLSKEIEFFSLSLVSNLRSSSCSSCSSLNY